MENNKPKLGDFSEMYVISADMGYGHQRAAYPLKDHAAGGIITLNNYEGIDPEERETWTRMTKEYERLSYFKKVPLLGNFAFAVMDYFQKIPAFYPRRDLSKPSLQEIFFYREIKNGVGKNLVARLNKNPLPFMATFFAAAFAAEYYNYQGDIYLVVCDTDVARTWAPLNPEVSRIIYLAPNKRVKERLMLYGVRPEKIYITGFPLPKENIGNIDSEYVKEDLRKRLEVLDPAGSYRKKYAKLIEAYLCPIEKLDGPTRPLTLTFAVGGAGAQRDLGVLILEKLKNKILEGKLCLNLVAGSRPDVFAYYSEKLKEHFLHGHPNIRLIYSPSKFEYFAAFNKILRTTDVLWTKPSELSFYAGLGLPIIITDPIGSQEDYNRRWLLGVGAGVDTKNPNYVHEWLFDFLDSGWLAEAAMNGYLNAPKMGTYNIENLVLRHKVNEIENVRLL